jgi:hypothetical protein
MNCRADISIARWRLCIRAAAKRCTGMLVDFAVWKASNARLGRHVVHQPHASCYSCSSLVLQPAVGMEQDHQPPRYHMVGDIDWCKRRMKPSRRLATPEGLAAWFMHKSIPGQSEVGAGKACARRCTSNLQNAIDALYNPVRDTHKQLSAL